MSTKFIPFEDFQGTKAYLNPRYIKFILDNEEYLTAHVDGESHAYDAKITYEEFLKLLKD